MEQASKFSELPYQIWYSSLLAIVWGTHDHHNPLQEHSSPISTEFLLGFKFSSAPFHFLYLLPKANHRPRGETIKSGQIFPLSLAYSWLLCVLLSNYQGLENEVNLWTRTVRQTSLPPRPVSLLTVAKWIIEIGQVWERDHDRQNNHIPRTSVDLGWKINYLHGREKIDNGLVIRPLSSSHLAVSS